MIFDFHCDLLSYLASHPYRLAYDDASRASIHQMKKGQVYMQALAIFSTTKKRSSSQILKQSKAYKELFTKYSGYFFPYKERHLVPKGELPVFTLLAIENASTFCEEDEALSKGILRLRKVVENVEKPLYVSLTWNTENRFGGGNACPQVGLKSDGKALLEELEDICFAIDLSHTSDRLAHDIINFIDKKKLKLKIMASHSNLRSIQNVARNLPQEIADEIVRRDGVIGFNVIRSFVGKSPEDLLKHLEYALKRGYENNLVFGCDFFYEKSAPKSLLQAHGSFFFDEYDSAACYPKLQKLLRKVLSQTQLEKICHKNAEKFLKQF